VVEIDGQEAMTLETAKAIFALADNDCFTLANLFPGCDQPQKMSDTEEALSRKVHYATAKRLMDDAQTVIDANKLGVVKPGDDEA